MINACLPSLPHVATLQLRGVRTSTNRTSPTPSALVFLRPKSAQIKVQAPVMSGGRLIQDPAKGNMSAVRLYRSQPPGNPYRIGAIERKQTEAFMPNSRTLKRYHAVSIRTRNTFTVTACSFVDAMALLPDHAAITRRTKIRTAPAAQEVAA